ncbi:MAG: cation diffusion facilitator family transporter, partial [Clostridia bacterium]|nr:cation diffusion facilitator family transporter [Clostridia bacterium]
VCIVLNVLLSVAKITVGALFALVSVVADGVNNLTDCGSNVVSLVSIKFAQRPADKEHPYGHRRAEYIASMIVSFIVLVASAELAFNGITGIVDAFSGNAPQISFELCTVIVLSVSILVKLWMFAFNKILAKRYKFDLLNATAMDSIADVGATTAVLIAVIVSYFTGFNVDGFMTVAVAVVIAIGGVKILRETLRHLMGEGADEQTAHTVVERIKKFDGVLGVHDLNIHNYGPNRYYASAHVEVDCNVPVLQSHDMIDQIERDFAQNTNIQLVIHMDPIVTDDPELGMYKDEVLTIVHTLDCDFDIHDFRMVKGVTHTNLIFDVAISYETKLTAEQIMAYIQAEINKLHDNVYVVPTVEKQIK